MLEHVHPEQLIGVAVDRRVERQDDRHKPGDERRRAQRLVPRPHRAGTSAQPVQDPGGRHVDERGLDRPAVPAHGSDDVEDDERPDADRDVERPKERARLDPGLEELGVVCGDALGDRTVDAPSRCARQKLATWVSIQ